MSATREAIDFSKAAHFVFFYIFLLSANFLTGLYSDNANNIYYQPTMCAVLEKQLTQNLFFSQPRIRISYNPSIHLLNLWVKPSQRYPDSVPRFFANSLLADYHVGTTVPCWYNTKNVNEVILDRHYHIINWIKLLNIAGVSLALLMIYPIFNPNMKSMGLGPLKIEVIDNFKIVYYLFGIEYTYIGNQPLTLDMVPRLKEGSRGEHRAKVIFEQINKKGSCYIFRLPVSYFVLVVMIINTVILYYIIFTRGRDWG